MGESESGSSIKILSLLMFVTVTVLNSSPVIVDDDVDWVVFLVVVKGRGVRDPVGCLVPINIDFSPVGDFVYRVGFVLLLGFVTDWALGSITLIINFMLFFLHDPSMSLLRPENDPFDVARHNKRGQVD